MKTYPICVGPTVDTVCDSSATRTANRRLSVFVILVFLYLRPAIYAQEACAYTAGQFELNTVWSAPTVCVNTNITVSNLTVLPGVTVLVSGNFTITCVGPIYLLGNSNAPIVVRPSSNNTNGWGGFYFENTSPGSEFDYAVIEGAHNSALRLLRTTFVIRNTRFANCGGLYGAAIYADIPGRILSVSNCTFTSNQAINDGGAIWCSVSTGRLEVISCVFNQNVANPAYQTRNTGGGAIWVDGNVLLLQSHFQSNQCHAFTIYSASGVFTRGGAVYASGGNFEVTACEFIENGCTMTAEYFTPDTSYARGGAFYADSGTVSFRNNLLVRNHLSAQNRQQLGGSAFYLRQGIAGLTNVTILENTGAPAVFNEAGSVAINSSILFLNYDHINQLTGNATVSYSTVQGGYPGTGNTDFAPVMDGQYRILLRSTTIDMGDPSPAMNDTSFPPSLGTVRNDAGHLGGQFGALWNYSLYSEPQGIFRVELGHAIFWDDQAGVYLEYAVSVAGPWYRYSGQSFSINGKLAVLVSPSEARQFYRLVRP